MSALRTWGIQTRWWNGTFYKIRKDTGEIFDTMKDKDCAGRGGYHFSYKIYGDGLIYVSHDRWSWLLYRALEYHSE